jgi:CBS domain-containing protein
MIPNRMVGKNTFVEEIMTEELITVNEDTSATEALALMVNNNIRHLPVMDEKGKVLGLLSLKRVMKHFFKVLASSVKELHEEINVLV